MPNEYEMSLLSKCCQLFQPVVAEELLGYHTFFLYFLERKCAEFLGEYDIQSTSYINNDVQINDE